MGSVYVEGDELEAAQQALSDAVTLCQRSGMRTLVFGGGHETAWAHGRGVMDAFPNERVVIINPMPIRSAQGRPGDVRHAVSPAGALLR